MRRHRVFSLPEEPLRNACVGALSVADNMALRNFDRPPLAQGSWLRRGAVRAQSQRLIGEYKVKTPGPDAPIRTLSGGNVQRAVLARELSGDVSVLIVANPVFGLDFAAVAEIHGRILAARDAGAAVLLVSDDLDELLELSDRIVVMFDGRLVHETPIATADIGRDRPCMAGHAGVPPRTWWRRLEMPATRGPSLPLRQICVPASWASGIEPCAGAIPLGGWRFRLASRTVGE